MVVRHRAGLRFKEAIESGESRGSGRRLDGTAWPWIDSEDADQGFFGRGSVLQRVGETDQGAGRAMENHAAGRSRAAVIS